MSTSNKFTTVRIIAAPVVFLIYFVPIWLQNFGLDSTLCDSVAKYSAFILIPFLIFAEITDALDGHYARKHNEVSDFGKVFDPFADVILHISTFCCLMFSYKSELRFMPPVIFVFILYREITMTFLRMVAAMRGTAIAARKGGKLKTVFYVLSAFFALILELHVRAGFVMSYPIFAGLRVTAICLFSVCLILSYVSFIDYLIAFKSVFSLEKK
ncbi:MAG: CDP-diacylglycerol--glycerol-3-phosphate 3-phosphatidyltransferase [Treponema sp.]|nr:CDP-diacylglycerol--glycerol-3-phosphate 3-phosphatidyltransferase [Treponema sp.]